MLALDVQEHTLREQLLLGALLGAHVGRLPPLPAGLLQQERVVLEGAERLTRTHPVCGHVLLHLSDADDVFTYPRHHGLVADRCLAHGPGNGCGRVVAVAAAHREHNQQGSAGARRTP
ncbi:MAG: hypothetical protein IPG81_07775 [Sandaracinaceae bacterium]|nr:hypothetical protein [Sandaracinaceae bacterium]